MPRNCNLNDAQVCENVRVFLFSLNGRCCSRKEHTVAVQLFICQLVSMVLSSRYCYSISTLFCMTTEDIKRNAVSFKRRQIYSNYQRALSMTNYRVILDLYKLRFSLFYLWGYLSVWWLIVLCVCVRVCVEFGWEGERGVLNSLILIFRCLDTDRLQFRYF